MAHFAKLNSDNIVVNVVVVDNSILLKNDGTESEIKGKKFLNALLGSATWVQTSYNNNFRYKFAAMGDVYDSENNVFRKATHFESWTIDDNGIWQPPVEKPNDGNPYDWDEESQQWILLD